MKPFLLLFAMLAVITTSYSQSNFAATQYVAEAAEAGTFAGLTAGLAVGDEIKWVANAGYCDKERSTPCNDSTLYRTASIAKPITAVAALQLYERGQLDLDLPIQHYLPDYPAAAAAKITTRQLLHQTTGIGGYASGKEAQTKENYPDLAAAIRIFQDRPLDFEPGTRFQYTTYGYVLLGRVIEAAAGQPYGDYVREHIFVPAGMRDTDIEIFGREYTNKSAFFYRNKKGKIKNSTPNNLSNRIPGGGFHTTVGDLLRFGQALLNHTLIEERTFQLMTTDSEVEHGQNNPYGMGLFLYGDNPTYGPVMGHNGEQTGAGSQLMLLPERKAVIVVLSNTSRAGRDAFMATVDLFSFLED